MIYLQLNEILTTKQSYADLDGQSVPKRYHDTNSLRLIELNHTVNATIIDKYWNERYHSIRELERDFPSMSAITISRYAGILRNVEGRKDAKVQQDESYYSLLVLIPI